MTDRPAMTERERYIIAQALYEFIRHEQSRPAGARRQPDEDEAKAILHEWFDNELARLVESDEAAGRDPTDCARKVSLGG